MSEGKCTCGEVSGHAMGCVMFSIHPYRTLLLESEAKAKLVKELLEEQAHSIKVQNELAELVEANAKYRKAWDTLTESLNGYSATYLGNGKSAAKQVLEVMSELMKEKP